MSKCKTTEEFVTEAKIIHGDKYDYGKTVYVNAKTKVLIICSIHGEFKQTPNNHLGGKGCLSCAITLRAKNRSTGLKAFIDKANKVHSNKYNYTKTKYINTHNKVLITCPIHGDFEQSPHNHLISDGCPICSQLNRRMSINEFIEKSKQVHSDKYSYELTNYTIGKEVVIITCPIHGKFTQLAESHLNGRGCNKCATGGFNPNKPAYLYYLKITTEESQILYKIGITNRTVDERFSLADLSKIEIVKQKLYDIGQDAYDWEQKLLKMYKQYQYKGPNVLESGNTELFTEDIIAMYYAENNINLETS